MILFILFVSINIICKYYSFIKSYGNIVLTNHLVSVPYTFGQLCCRLFLRTLLPIDLWHQAVHTNGDFGPCEWEPSGWISVGYVHGLRSPDRAYSIQYIYIYGYRLQFRPLGWPVERLVIHRQRFSRDLNDSPAWRIREFREGNECLLSLLIACRK